MRSRSGCANHDGARFGADHRSEVLADALPVCRRRVCSPSLFVPFGVWVRGGPEDVRGLFGKVLEPMKGEVVGNGSFFGFVFSNGFAPVKADPAGGEVARS